MAVGEQQGNTRNIIFQLQKKKYRRYTTFFAAESSQPRQRFRQLQQQQEGRLLEVVRGVGEKESSRSFSLPRPQLSRLWTSMN